MSLTELVLISVALSMDAVAVSMSNRMAFGKIAIPYLVGMPLLFGFFQGLMPLMGYFAGGLFASFLSTYSGILVFLILGFIGFKMIKDGIDATKSDNEEPTLQKTLNLRTLLLQAIATSIDAFAVGVGFTSLNVTIIPTSLLIAFVTAIFCSIALVIGKKCGDYLGPKSTFLGGGILLYLAVSALFS